MELYQTVALGLMVALGFVANFTLRLNNFRKRNGVVRDAVNLRDLAVVRQPANFDAEEVRLVRSSWIACAVSFALVLLLLSVSPDDLIERFRMR